VEFMKIVLTALFVYNSNLAAVAPDQSAVRAGLARDDLLTVVMEHFQTDTADYADYLLPATTQLEHWDILKPYGHLYLALNRPAIAPLGESLPNSEIFRRLARSMGFKEDAFEQDDISILQAFIDAQTHPTMAGITWERLLDEGFVRLNLPEPFLPFAHGFPTPDGKCQIYSQQMADDGYDPLPAWTPPNWLKINDQRSMIEESHSEASPPSIINHQSLTPDFPASAQLPQHHLRQHGSASARREGSRWWWISPRKMAGPRAGWAQTANRVHSWEKRKPGGCPIWPWQITENLYAPGGVLRPNIWGAK